MKLVCPVSNDTEYFTPSRSKKKRSLRAVRYKVLRLTFSLCNARIARETDIHRLEIIVRLSEYREALHSNVLYKIKQTHF